MNDAKENKFDNFWIAKVNKFFASLLFFSNIVYFWFLNQVGTPYKYKKLLTWLFHLLFFLVVAFNIPDPMVPVPREIIDVRGPGFATYGSLLLILWVYLFEYWLLY